MCAFVYPPYVGVLDEKPPFGPREYPCQKDPRWKGVFEAIVSKYGGEHRVLPAGTKVYRGTLFETLYNPVSKGPVFFGLDVLISLWILAESYHPLVTKPDFGYVYEFELTKDLAYEYIQKLDCTAMDKPYCDVCAKKPCVHPQVILHNGSSIEDHVEVGTELTLPLEVVESGEVLKEVRKHKVDVKMLIAHEDQPYWAWDPVKAIMGVDDGIGGGRVGKSKKRTIEKIKCRDGRLRTVYIGPRGGKYVKVKSEWVSAKLVGISFQ